MHLLNMGILIASLFNKKALLWINGRKNIFERIKQVINPEDKIVWFHSSSLGEFEQGRPVIEGFRKKHPEYKILLTFFSPSGYEIRKNYNEADYIFYLPIDTISNAERFIRYVNPQLAYFIKYEYWYNFLNTLHEKNIPVFMISAIYRPEQHFFKWYGAWFRKHLRTIKHFFVQNEESKLLLNKIGINNVTVSGDTRFDRVYAILQEAKSFQLIEDFRKNKQLFIAGSTWEKDEEILYDLYSKELKDNGEKGKRKKYILAPHKIDESHINSIINRFEGKAVRYSKMVKAEELEADVLIIDTIGMLSHIYRYAAITYIGGGFGSGIHNILEAAVFSKPVIFGPIYQKFLEAKELIELGGAFSIDNSEKLIEIVKKLEENKFFFSRACGITHNYTFQRQGATEKILNFPLN